jgi:hypothetical protein
MWPGASGAVTTVGYVGTNLAAPSNFSTEYPFLNVLKNGIQWITNQQFDLADTGEEQYLQLDSNGYPTTMAGAGGHTFTANQFCVTLYAGLSNYPSGQYIILYDGAGSFNYGLDASVVSRSAGRDVINVATPSGGFFVAIASTDPSSTGNYIRNIRVVQAAYETILDQGSIFHPILLGAIQPFTCIRFMDWMQTNFSDQSAWTNRPVVTQVFYGASPGSGGANTVYANGELPIGVPVEIMVALANQLGIMPWFCMPHLATDNYVSSFAALVWSLLSSSLNVYVEYSNETWNGSFGGAHGQFTYMSSQELVVFGSNDPTISGRSFFGLRTAQVQNLWKTTAVAAGVSAARLVRVLGSQAASTQQTTTALNAQLWTTAQGGISPPVKNFVDVVAGAPYFGFEGAPTAWGTLYQTDPVTALNYIFAAMYPNSGTIGGQSVSAAGYIGEVTTWMSQQITTALTYGLGVVCYEGCQGFTAIGNATQTEYYIAANGDTRMGTAVVYALQQWRAVAGGQSQLPVYNVYNDCGTWGDSGMWGLCESFYTIGSNNITNSPKYLDTIKLIKGS